MALYNTADADSNRKAGDVVAVLGGGRLLDTASTYGDAETVIGDILAAGARRDQIFLATKLETPDAGELQRSLERLKTAKLDFLQLHNERSRLARAGSTPPLPCARPGHCRQGARSAPPDGGTWR